MRPTPSRLCTSIGSAMLIPALALASAQALAQTPPSATSTPAPTAQANATKDPISALDLPLAYQQEIGPQLEYASAHGLDAKTIAILDDPQTPYGQRAALIQAATQNKRATRASERYLKQLKHTHGAKRLELNRLATHELYNLGWMLALESPKTLQAAQGPTEVERADPLTLLNAASNRLRGEQTIQLTLAITKAQLAHTQPQRALCEPSRCIDAVLENYTTHWSMHPAAVCQMVDAVAQLSPQAPPQKSQKLCARAKDEHAHNAIIYKPHPDAPDPVQNTHQRFSQPTPPSVAAPQITMAMLQQMGFPIAMLPKNINLNDPVAMQRFIEQQLQQQMQMIQNGVSASPNPNAAPSFNPFGQLTPNQAPHAGMKVIDLQNSGEDSEEDATQPDSIAVDSGVDDPQPQRPTNKEINLDDTNESDEAESATPSGGFIIDEGT